jgi:hypothetical protein
MCKRRRPLDEQDGLNCDLSGAAAMHVPEQADKTVDQGRARGPTKYRPRLAAAAVSAFFVHNAGALAIGGIRSSRGHLIAAKSLNFLRQQYVLGNLVFGSASASPETLARS